MSIVVKHHNKQDCSCGRITNHPRRTVDLCWRCHGT